MITHFFWHVPLAVLAVLDAGSQRQMNTTIRMFFLQFANIGKRHIHHVGILCGEDRGHKGKLFGFFGVDCCLYYALFIPSSALAVENCQAAKKARFVLFVTRIRQ